MKTKLKAKWLRALRSGKYRQGNGSLVCLNGENFCCLGVLADIQGCVWEESQAGLHPIMPRGRETFGINSNGDKSICYLKPRKAGGLSITTQKTLASINDAGQSFVKIADYIEKNICSTRR